MAYLLSGPWGIAIGLATGLLAAFGAELFSTKEAASGLDKELQSIKDQSDKIRFGVQTQQELEAVREMVELQRQINQLREVYTETDDLGRRGRIATRVRELQAELLAQRKILEEYEKARENLTRNKELYEDILGSAEGLRLANEALLSIYAAQLEKMDGMVDAATRISRLVARAREVNNNGLDPEDPRNPNGPIWNEPYGRTSPFARTSSGSGGGGGGGAAGAADAAADAFARWKDEVNALMRSTQDFSRSFAQSFGQTMVNSLFSFTDALSQGQLSMKDFARSVFSDLTKIMLRALAVTAILRLIPGNKVGNPSSLFGLGLQTALGIPINPNLDATSLSAFAKGGVVNGPTMFPMRGGTGLMGESGPEAIMPLKRDSSGALGVGGAPVNINVINNAGVHTSIDRQADGTINIILDTVREEFARSMVTGQGVWARGIEAGYASRRKFT